ncbi:MAG TPA: MarR family transcriptional regulator [candidate division Zixibacteria bacterium]|nr:MarR family transcriptional regulator [candidate division Zixibacteria bacterium]
MTAWLLRRYTQQLLDEAGLALSFDHAVVILKTGDAGELPQHEIVACLARDKTSTTRWLDDLEKRGLVKRKTAREDRRHKLVSLTARGEKLRGPIQDALDEAHRCALKGIGARDKTCVEKVLKSVRENLSQVLSSTGCVEG